MYRLQDIQEALFHVVGWEQSFVSSEMIKESLTESESGLTFQDAHPLLTLKNVKSIMPEDFEAQYSPWNRIISYNEGDLVSNNGRVYMATQSSVGVEPPNNDFNDDFSEDFSRGDYWKEYNSLSDYLELITKSGIRTAVQKFVQDKKLSYETRDLLVRKTFFDGAARLKATITPQSRLVGMEIIPVRAMGVTMKIEKIGLQMVGGTGTVRLYLFHSSQSSPVKTIDVNFTNTNGGFQWFKMTDLYLPYISDGTDAGGSWFLCYNQDDLPFGMQALNVSKDWSREPCGTCNIGSVQTWREITKYMQISPFFTKAPQTFASHPTLWNTETNVYTNTMNYGINCEVTVGCDLTDFIISQRNIFQDVIQKQVACTVLHTMAMNPEVRVNRNQSNVSKMDILYELDGDISSKRKTGLKYDLEQAYKALSIDTKGLDRICLACHNGGVRYSTV